MIFALLFKLVQSADGDCTTNQWPYSCEANFKIGLSECEPCEMGRYGCNCSQICSIGTYGLNCYHHCDCSADEVCDPAVGCTNVTTTLSPTTFSQSTTRIYNSTSMKLYSTPYKKSDKAPPKEKSDTDKSMTLQVIVIVLVSLLVVVVISCKSCVCFLMRRNSKAKTYRIGSKSREEVQDAEYEENNDAHSYLTISERSVRLYASVHYDEAEEGKSSPSLSIHSKKEHTSTESDNSKESDNYLIPIMNTVEETKADSHPPCNDKEDFNDITKCILLETCI